MKITIYDYKRKIDFKNDAKGIRDFILLLNKMFKENGIRIYIGFSYKNSDEVLDEIQNYILLPNIDNSAYVYRMPEN